MQTPAPFAKYFALSRAIARKSDRRERRASLRRFAMHYRIGRRLNDSVTCALLHAINVTATQYGNACRFHPVRYAICGYICEQTSDLFTEYYNRG